MKIARIDSQSVKVPYTFGGSHKGEGLRTWTTNNILLVRVETDSGLVGWGEAFCYGCTDAVKAALHNMIAPLAIGQDARDIAGLSYDLQQKLHLFGRYASPSLPCRASTSRCGTSPARRPTCRSIVCWAACAATACRPTPAC